MTVRAHKDNRRTSLPWPASPILKSSPAGVEVLHEKLFHDQLGYYMPIWMDTSAWEKLRRNT